jgi:hypothetical protein
VAAASYGKQWYCKQPLADVVDVRFVESPPQAAQAACASA